MSKPPGGISKKKEEGMTGTEMAIILIAFLLIITAFGYAAAQTGMFQHSKPQGEGIHTQNTLTRGFTREAPHFFPQKQLKNAKKYVTLNIEYEYIPKKKANTKKTRYSPL